MPNPFVTQHAQKQVQSFLDELKNGTRNYRTVASLGEQVAQEYRGRCILELLQNAHDALSDTTDADIRSVAFVLRSAPEPELLIANSGMPFLRKDFEGISQLGQSPKDPNKSVGNKGLGFRSVLEVCSCPEIWSSQAPGEVAGFAFGFTPHVLEMIADAIQELETVGLAARSPFACDKSLVDWSPEQLDVFRERVATHDLDPQLEVRSYLSPYLIPVQLGNPPTEVQRFWNDGYVTVIRLRLDGGRTGDPGEAVSSVTQQLRTLERRSLVFLNALKKLTIEIDGEVEALERSVKSESPSEKHPHRHQQIVIQRPDPKTDGDIPRVFDVWTQQIGGEDDPDGEREIESVVAHLPNRWPEVRAVSVGVAVESVPDPKTGVFVIFLPTEVTTGSAALINAPFYGSLDRRQIVFDDPYNELLMSKLVDLILDAVVELIASPPDVRRSWAVVDLLSSTSTVGGKTWKLMDRICSRAGVRGISLKDLPLLMCDHKWDLPARARAMPTVPEGSPIQSDVWERHANFSIVASELRDRLPAVNELVNALGGRTEPTAEEFGGTIQNVAQAIKAGHVTATWDEFLESVVAILPPELKATPRRGVADSLASFRFLPTQDDRLLSANDTATVFFQPTRGADDAADFVGDVPKTLQPRVAFLHPSIRTQEGPQRRNTDVQKLLDGRFVSTFRREDLLRDVVLPAIPELPASHDTTEAGQCAELLAWAVKLVGDEEPESLLPLVRRIPVPCHGGWYAMAQTVFGPGWGKLGEHLWTLANELPMQVGQAVKVIALLPPSDPKWPCPMKGRGELLKRAGVVPGLRLVSASEAGWSGRFSMEGHGNHQLPKQAPFNVPEEHWDSWRRRVRREAKPYYDGEFFYELSNVYTLPCLHYLDDLSTQGKQALSQCILASFPDWPDEWQSAKLRKTEGNPWSTSLTSPLKHFLMTLVWLHDQSKHLASLGDRWFVPESLLRGQLDRYSHLNPLSPSLARTLWQDEGLLGELKSLGLNVYPTETDQIGPELLNALGKAWARKRIPLRRFDVFMGQVRQAWRHFDPTRGLPSQFLVRSGRRNFAIRSGDELSDAYLPDSRDRTRTLQEHGRPILEMNTEDAIRLADSLTRETTVRRASRLEERITIDGVLWAGQAENVKLLNDTEFAWLSPVLLTIAAHGGPRPTGQFTKPWEDASDRLRRAAIIECNTATLDLVDGDTHIASSEPDAIWLPGDILAVRRSLETSYEQLAPACQAILERQDLLKDLRLVLGSLSGHLSPTTESIENALERSEVDAQSFADIRHRWAGSTSSVIDRLRPVLVTLEVSEEGLEAAAAEEDNLRGWLMERVTRWPVDDLLTAARRSRDDAEMGRKAWAALGDVAQLPKWNIALSGLGDRYVAVENRRVDEQVAAHFDSLTPFTRALARTIARAETRPEWIIEIEKTCQDWQYPPAWRTSWWEVPFSSVCNSLADALVNAGVQDEHLSHLRNQDSLEAIRQHYGSAGIPIEPDPFDIAGRNWDALGSAVARVHDLHCAWVQLADDRIAIAIPTLTQQVPPDAYVDLWSDSTLVARAIALLGDEQFATACEGCEGADEIRDRLGLTPDAVKKRREERLRKQQESERKRRTFDVAGADFEVGVGNYSELFKRLSDLPTLESGPLGSDDEFSSLLPPGPGSGGGGGPGKKGKSSHLRPPAELRELVGIVGEIQAYRFLRASFGEDVVTRESWLSEIRTKIIPLVPGEPDNTSDGHGFDFRFRYSGKLWHIEVKATTGEDEQFEVSIGEIEVASRLAGDSSKVWRFLRVSNALSATPQFEWLPNPFDEKFRKLYRIQKAGMRISYARKAE